MSGGLRHIGGAGNQGRDHPKGREKHRGVRDRDPCDDSTARSPARTPDLFASKAAATVGTLRQLSWAKSPIAGLQALNMVRDDDDPVKADARQRADLRQEIDGQIVLTIAAECGALDALDLLARAPDGEFRKIPTAVANDLKSKLRHERLRAETTVVLPTGMEDETAAAMVPEAVKLESGNIPPTECDRELEKARRDRRRREQISINVVENAHGQNRRDSAPHATALLEQLRRERPDLGDGLEAALSPLPRNEQSQRDGVSRGTTINRVNRVRRFMQGKTESS